jgi:hypothetical protein
LGTQDTIFRTQLRHSKSFLRFQNGFRGGETKAARNDSEKEDKGIQSYAQKTESLGIGTEEILQKSRVLIASQHSRWLEMKAKIFPSAETVWEETN